MKKAASAFLLLMTMVLVCFVDASAQGGTDSQQASKASLEQAVNTFLEAVKAKNAEKMRGYYAPDYTFTGQDGKVVSADERLKQMAAPGFAAPSSFSDVSVRTYGNAGVATGVSTLKNATGGNDEARFTQTWVWQPPGRWVLAASHVTQVAP